jgi:glycosyltransferase involved in cell wall biosynthesis
MDAPVGDTSPRDGAASEKSRGVIAAIPCYNEEIYVGSVVLKASEYADQVVVVDDGSADKTAQVAEKAGAIVMKHGTNRGKGAAVGTAFEYAGKIGCSALVLLDGDGQHEPSYIPALVKPVLDGTADMVVGSRYLRIESSVPAYRIWGHRVLTLLTNVGSRVKLTDSQSGLRAFSPKAIEAFAFVEEGLSVESEMQFLANEAGLRVTEVPISVSYHGRAKRSPIAHGMGVLNSIIGFISRRIPLLFFGVPGLAMLAVAVWQGWRVVQGYSEFGDFYMGPALMAVLFGVVGALSVFTGLILHTIRSFFR